MDWREFRVAFPLLVSCRLLLALTPFVNSLGLDHNHQLSSPTNSYVRLQEGLFLFKHDIDPYAGGSFYHSPLYLSLFTTVLPTSRFVSRIVWTMLDVLGAWALVNIWRERQSVVRTSRDTLVAAAYLLNPYILLPNLALSTVSFENTLQLLVLLYACRRRPSPALLLAAILIHLSLYSALLLPSIALLLLSSPHSHLANPKFFTAYRHPNASLSTLLSYIGECVLYSVVLCLCCTVVAGGWGWVEKTWGVVLTLPDLTPNPGLWWYFFTEMFDHFRPFFLMVFSVHLLIYVAPVCLKFQHDPLFASFALLGVLGMFKPYLTLADPGLFLSMYSVFPEIFPYLSHPLPTTLLHLHASLLLPLFHSLWLNQGTGNANFFYASTLVLGMANGAALVDAIWAGLRIAIGGKESEDEGEIAVVQE
ncbi:PIG-U-domain-containing protein [Gloeophyllum trabeum ATCC 11539]|uniref:PIG-U-domain-containing protein n=1 Tax=Gloeophyllum trabeum (strain ATCC 11539 / FP-39264 / Madison 617) TaxID=670483 RepID=S7RV59_GLOTA|nr:PIG-U-domain-containing protein [Gloeophyllum trabeum ATCC 11539]EPQ57109.1 PIG-U-domain-containing protein [Gloeophyllum trabeum ATCC 11539]